MGNETSTEPYEPDDRLHEAIASFEQARDDGLNPDPAEWLDRYPDVAERLWRYFADCKRLVRRAEPLRPPAPVAGLPRPFGAYELLEEIGRGGMGVVYKARQPGTDQLVALKLLRPDWLARLDEPTRRLALEQFRNEARAAARLQHRNRVRILHLGEHEGRPFYAMELIEGCSLADKLTRRGVSKEAGVTYLISIAEALQDAHDHGILHRDIKPGNILIDEQDDVAKLTDFGLAMSAPPGTGPAEQSVREQAQVAGTLPYMSPEQTQGADGVTVRSEVYSLGATLYETLTGTRPFTGAPPAELIARILDGKPDPPRRHNPNIDPELERICLRCLRKDQKQRFATAGELAEALRNYRTDRDYLRNFTTLGTLMIGLGPINLVIDLVVYWMLQGSFWEPVVWLLMFSHCLLKFPALLLARRFPRQQGGPGRREYWMLWGGHIVATVGIAVALRTELAVPPRDVILLMYSVFAALNGWAYFIEASKMSWKLSWGPVGFWLVGVAMLFHREAAPIYFGVYLALATVAYGLYLRKLGKQLS
jgi:serine/threonine-protein kinase